ncbi:C_GCAxxG_C_C family protein [candidate division WOR-3 bacterium]|nr:C_GCAxxG_C_C family protein [candidate division WOR-3 bacterium]
MKREKVVEGLFMEKGFNCAQSVFLSFSGEMGLDDEAAMKLTSPFGGGIARLENLCGAVMGGIMAIGLYRGQYSLGQTEKREETYKLTREFIDKFVEMNGSIICKDLVKCDMNTEEGKKFMKDNKVREKVCLKCVKDAVKTIESLL